MKTPLGTEVDLVPSHIVLDGDPAPPRKWHSSPLFSAHVYCGDGRPSQLLLSSCEIYFVIDLQFARSLKCPTCVSLHMATRFYTVAYSVSILKV